MRRRISAPLFLVCSLVLPACSSDGGDNQPAADAAARDAAAVDQAAPAPDAGSADLYPDLGELPDVGVKQDPCEGEWIDAVNAHDKVSTGIVAQEEVSPGVQRTLVDASAGGMQVAKDNPYIYISFKDGKQVEITDLESKTSTAWDLALRRTVIRVNGGDSGPGQGAVAILPGKSFDEVTAAPAASAFATDEFIDESCGLTLDPINNIRTAFGGSTGLWYDYSIGMGKVTPLPQIYVLRRADGSHVKLEIESYYGSTGLSSHYSLKWSAL